MPPPRKPMRSGVASAMAATRDAAVRGAARWARANAARLLLCSCAAGGRQPGLVRDAAASMRGRGGAAGAQVLAR
jgi:hypothetical protein